MKKAMKIRVLLVCLAVASAVGFFANPSQANSLGGGAACVPALGFVCEYDGNFMLNYTIQEGEHD